MNNIAASILYHSDEVITFELVIRLLNDYHLKEVHMNKLPGLYLHCDIIQLIVK
jgi:Rab-GTPase-TBC domain